MSADEVEQGKEEDPHNIDEVPIKSKVVDCGCMAVDVSALVGPVEQNRQYRDADDHVQRVHTRHREVQKEEDLGMLRHVRGQRYIAGIFRMDEVLDAEG